MSLQEETGSQGEDGICTPGEGPWEEPGPADARLGPPASPLETRVHVRAAWSDAPAWRPELTKAQGSFARPCGGLTPSSHH